MSANQYSGAAYSSAAERNRQPILNQLRILLPENCTVLEIGSGTGQHAIFFSQHLKSIQWQPSDKEDNLASLEVRLTEEGNPRILPSLKLDVMTDAWPQRTYTAAYSANTAHIMSWQAVEAMFAGIAIHLEKNARFCLYGPFNISGKYTAESNARFDRQLRLNSPEMGIRDMEAIERLANFNQMYLDREIAMPANNYILVFVRK